ncbi:RluA family pseudouridine synthase [Angustibacter sp. McL0619]|uniref:RluA family pseudouridine synthase n=1 Tax=Angustibacter sp. McL0619 TaxID=3415676 RepID=UPI003CF3295B
MRRALPSPLPRRHGLEPAELRLPDDGQWPTLLDYLRARLPWAQPGRLEAMLDDGEVVDRDGPLGRHTPYRPGTSIWFHRDLPDEAPVPFEIDVLYRDDDLLVVDKPHFLATIPRGRHVLQTALVRLRTELDLPALSPAHRLDRITAGVVLFVVRPELRGAYQSLFEHRSVRKVYEAVAPFDPAVELPVERVSRIVKERGVFAAQELPGEPNSSTRIELVEQRGELGRYRLLPVTGRTHQLRLHLCALGLPILGDPLYPVVLDRAVDDWSRPLQLLARSLEFTDPLSGQARRFESRRSLQAWTAYGEWLGAVPEVGSGALS